MRRSRIIFLFFVTASITASLLSCSSGRAKAKQYTLKVTEVLPHDRAAYTQGLFFDGGRLYESTGQYGQSSMRLVDLESGSVLRKTDLDSSLFGEGSCIFGGKLYILTWQEHKVLVCNPETFEIEKTLRNPYEGWGLTTDGKKLYLCDGTSTLRIVDPETFAVKREIRVRLEGKGVSYLNELEWIDGKIWANVYTQDYIVIINPSDGVVEGVVDCRGLLPDRLRSYDTDVLNGIAHDPASGKTYLTGKLWPRMYGIELKENK